MAIIDEIQMLTDIERGWAWTRALLGLCAKEIHVCGEERAANIVCLLADECNDNFEILNYQRLGQLRSVAQKYKSLCTVLAIVRS